MPSKASGTLFWSILRFKASDIRWSNRSTTMVTIMMMAIKFMQGNIVILWELFKI